MISVQCLSDARVRFISELTIYQNPVYRSPITAYRSHCPVKRRCFIVGKQPIRVVFLILSLICVPIALAAQGEYSLPLKSEYEKATIRFRDSTKSRVSKLSITSDSVSYDLKGVRKRSHLKALEYIQVDEGHRYTGRGALIGGGLGLVISGVSTWVSAKDPDVTIKRSDGSIIAVSTIGGAALGAMIGSAVRVKTTYYIHEPPPTSSETK